jgi:hypothetical protein
VPPFVGVAVNVTDAPAQIVVALAAIDTEGTRTAFTVIVIELDVAVTGETQVAFEVRITVTTSPLANVVLVNVVAFVPTFPPFTCHW